MTGHWDTVFSPGLYLDRDKKAIAFIEDRLLHQEMCAAVCMYGNGKDYLFTNLVKDLGQKGLAPKLKVLNTVSSDELRDFADMLEMEDEPTLCLVNLRIRKDVSWFVQAIERLRVQRGRTFVCFINSYVGDVYQAIAETRSPITHALVVLKRVPYGDALHIMDELAERFEFYPLDEQKQDIYKWSCGHVGLLRTLYLLKRQSPGSAFTQAGLLREPTVLERLNNIIHDIPPEKIAALQERQLSFMEKVFLEEFGYIDADGGLFHPLLASLVPKRVKKPETALSLTERRVLDYLRTHNDTVVSRDDIGKIVWGEEEWEDKYSDWAIGQLIYRLRKKMEYGSAAGAIETRKGQGFVYTADSIRGE